MHRPVTTAGVWVRADAPDVWGLLDEWLRAEGFEVGGEPDPDDRWVSVRQEGDWCWVFDSDLAGDTEALDELGRKLSSLAPTLAAMVTDSELGSLTAFSGRRRLGGASLPESARLVNGQLALRLPWLAPLVDEPDAATALTEGFDADTARVDVLLDRVLGVLGWPVPLQALRPLRARRWRRATKGGDRAPGAVGPARLELRQHPLPELTVGVPLPDSLALQVRQLGGAPSQGLAVQVRGDGVRGLGLTALVGWQGAPPGAHIQRVEVPLVEGHAFFAQAHLEVFAWPTIDGEVPTGRQLQRYRLALETQDRVQWLIELVGTPSEAGTHTVEVEVCSEGGVEVKRTLSWTVAQAPRTPLLPGPPGLDARQISRLARAHDTADYAVGRLWWARWSPALQVWLLRAVSRLAHWLGETPEVLWSHGGRHPRAPALPIGGAAWEALFDQLASQGHLRLGLQGWLQLVHDGDGVELLFALADPLSSFGRQRLADLLDEILTQAPGPLHCATISHSGAPWQRLEPPPWWLLAGLSQRWRDAKWLQAMGAGPGWRVRRLDGTVWCCPSRTPFSRTPQEKSESERVFLDRISADPGAPTGPRD